MMTDGDVQFAQPFARHDVLQKVDEIVGALDVDVKVGVGEAE